MIVVKKSITRNDDLCNAHVVSGIGISYLTMNNINVMVKKQEDKRRRRTMTVVRALLAAREILAMVNHKQKRLMQLDAKGGEVGELRRSCEMYGRNMIKKAHVQLCVKGLPQQITRNSHWQMDVCERSI